MTPSMKGPGDASAMPDSCLLCVLSCMYSSCMCLPKVGLATHTPPSSPSCLAPGFPKEYIALCTSTFHTPRRLVYVAREGCTQEIITKIQLKNGSRDVAKYALRSYQWYAGLWICSSSHVPCCLHLPTLRSSAPDLPPVNRCPAITSSKTSVYCSYQTQQISRS